MMTGIPTADDFNRTRVTNPDLSEVIRKRYYDWLLYPFAGTQQLTFFSQPMGQGVTTALGAVVGTAKTPWDTNLEMANTLPSGKSFMVESVEVLFLAGSSAAALTFVPQVVSNFAVAAAIAVTAFINDANTFAAGGLLEFNILSKNYLRDTPMLAFPGKVWFGVDAAVANTSATVGEIAIASARPMGRPYYLEPPITLQAAVNFEVQLKWPGLVALGSGFNARVGVYLDGYEMRATQ